MDHLWRLLTAVFIIATSVGLYVIGCVFSDGTVSGYLAGIVNIFVVPAGIVWGICRGVWVMLERHYQDKDE